MMILVNTDYISGKNLEMLGLVKGFSIQVLKFDEKSMSSILKMSGDNFTEYRKMMNTAHDIATKIMVQEAEMLGADAIVNVHYTSSTITMKEAAEVIVYGTAVKFV